MEKDILIPDLKVGNVLDFCNTNYNFSEGSEVTYDYSHMTHFEPFGMLLLGSKIRKIQRESPGVNFYDRDYKKHGYAAHMGFFQSVNQDYGNKPGEANGSGNYVPITEIRIKDLRIESYEKSEEIQDTIERKSISLSKVLSQGNIVLQEVISYSIRELMRNIVEHADSEDIWIAAQAWTSKDLVEIAILDEGVGIKQAISVNPNLEIESEEDAIRISIEPGISGKAFRHKGRMRKQKGSIWDNSGYGLYVTSEICQLGGTFLICSGGCALIMSNNKYKTRSTNFKGTAIRMRLKISEINKFGASLIQSIVKRGEQKAQENSEVAIVRASKVSRLSTSK